MEGLRERHPELAENLVDVTFGVVDAIAVPDVFVDLVGRPMRLFPEGYLELLEFVGREFRWSTAAEVWFEARKSLVVPAAEPIVSRGFRDFQPLGGFRDRRALVQIFDEQESLEQACVASLLLDVLLELAFREMLLDGFLRWSGDGCSPSEERGC